MKRMFTAVALVLLSFSIGCATGLKRVGYQLPAGSDAKNLQRCPIAVRSGAHYDAAAVEVVGGLKAFDTGFSTTCDEAYILDLFCKEACAIGADVVNVTEEHQPDWWSTCYRANAEFLRYKDREQAKVLLSDAKYAPELIIDRAEKSKKRTRTIIAASVMGGVLGGLIATAVTTP